MDEQILIKMGLKLDDMKSGLKTATDHVRDFAKNTSSQFESIKKIGEVFGVGFGLGKLKEYTEKILDYYGQIKGKSASIGVSSEFFQSFNLQASRFGIDAEKSEKALDKFAEKIGAARNGAESAKSIFAGLKIDLNDSSGKAKGTEEIFSELAEALKNIDDPAKRIAIAFEVFGKSAGTLMPLLSQGAEGIRNFKEAANGKILTDDDIERLDAAKKGMVDFGNSAMATGGEILSFIGAFGQFVGKVSSFFLKSPLGSPQEQKLAQLSAVHQDQIHNTGFKGGGEFVAQSEDDYSKVQALQKSLESKRREFALSAMKDSEKVGFLQSEITQETAKQLEFQKGSPAWLEKEMSILERKTEVINLQKRIEEETNNIIRERQSLEKRIADDEAELAKKKSDRSKYHSIDELAAADPSKAGAKLKADIEKAKTIQKAQKYANYLKGVDTDKAAAYQTRIDKMTAGIRSLESNERNPFETDEKRISENKLKLRKMRDPEAEQRALDMAADLASDPDVPAPKDANPKNSNPIDLPPDAVPTVKIVTTNKAAPIVEIPMEAKDEGDYGFATPSTAAHIKKLSAPAGISGLSQIAKTTEIDPQMTDNNKLLAKIAENTGKDKPATFGK